jgi:hypothetical protein
MGIREIAKKIFGPSHEWEPFHTRGTVVLLDGRIVQGDVMRRMINGKYQFRAVTEEDAWEEAEKHAW